ncbi:MAG: PilZ domain-containing protein [Desulfobulbus sp.]|nr:MAG: PilZ domain-containing protein [Desulfobulbus sp.]
MTADLRRSVRYADFLPISVTVGNISDDMILAGPFSARIVDISHHGACLLFTQVHLHSFHIFHSTRENEQAILHLQIQPPHTRNAIIIPAQPVWLHTEEAGGVKVFRIGVDFASAIDTALLQKINKMVNKI